MNKISFFTIFIFCVMIVQTQADDNSTSGTEESVVFTYDDHGKRDPLNSLVDKNGRILSREIDFSMADLKLEGIIDGADGKSIVIINGRILQVGDMIGAFRVSMVDKNSVVLHRGEERFTLTLGEE